MPNDFISRMARYVAFLYRERDVWDDATDRRDMVDLFTIKLETVRDICAMFSCRAEVWREVKTIYDFEEDKNETN